MRNPVEHFLERLDNVHPSGSGGWSASCPCRQDDRNPSLTVGIGQEGQVLVTCHRGTPCDLDQICDAVGLKPNDLWPDDDTPPPIKARPQRTISTVAKAKPASGSPGELTHTYDYTDVNGTLVMQVLRYVTDSGGKTFRQRIPNGNGTWTWSTAHLDERPLYRLPEIAAAVEAGEPVYVVEGEKDADALAALGHAATCNPMGADNGTGNKWRPEHTRALAGAKIWLIADRDDAGFLHAGYVHDQLVTAGAKVKLAVTPDGCKDVFDLLESTGSLDGLIRVTRDDLDGTPDRPPSLPAPVATDAGVTVSRQLAELLGDDRELLTTRLQKARRILDGLDTAPSERINPGRFTTWQELTSEADEGYKWLIPGVLEEQERVMIVAAEGIGKTMLARQVAICCAAGTHPFTLSRIPPVRTLFVDLENPERIIRRTARKIVDNVRHTWPDREITDAHLWIKPDGINILKPADRDRLEGIIEQARPQLLVMGPIYKMYIDPGSRTAEAVTIEVATYLDRLRELYGCALWLEHHAPLGNSLSGRDLRPMGSAVWMRWPEFGYALVPDPTAPSPEYEVKQWRGPRDLREWPTRLKRGALLPFEIA